MTDADHVAGNSGDLDADLAFGHHLLALADDVDAAEVEALAVSWFPHAGWYAEHVLVLAEEALLTGPWQVSAETRATLRLGPEHTQVFLLRCPVLRGAPAPAHLAHVDPLTASFPEGAPLGVEAAALEFLMAAARRLAGSVRVAGSGRLLHPDPDADVNLSLYSPIWLEPDSLVNTLRGVLPGIRLATDLAEFTQPHALPPPPVPDEPPLPEPERAWLEAESAAFDDAALEARPVLDGYGAIADLGLDGSLEVAVEGEDHPPLALGGLDWAENGVIAYALRWWPGDEEAAYAAEVSDDMREARGRVRALLEQAALALYAVVGGEVTDESGFLVEPESLA